MQYTTRKRASTFGVVADVIRNFVPFIVRVTAKSILQTFIYHRRSKCADSICDYPSLFTEYCIRLLYWLVDLIK